jgi:hypothetical protein
MAPEVVRRERLPDSRTDLFSMAVLFFYTLFGWHPLDGRREAAIRVLDPAAEMRLYGTDPLFLFDPDNADNGPVAGFHDPIVARWQSLPLALRKLFIRAFSEGLSDPSARVMETEWRNALRNIPQACFVCEECGMEHVAEAGAGGLSLSAECLACGEPLRPPPVMLIDRRAIVLTAGRKIDRSLLQPERRARDSETGAAVEKHPSRPDILGLRNLTDANWEASFPNQATHTVAPGQAVRIAADARIRFGKLSGTVIVPQGAKVTNP